MSQKIDPYQQGWDAVDKIPTYKHPVSSMGEFPTNPFPRGHINDTPIDHHHRWQREEWQRGFTEHLEAKVSEVYAASKKRQDEGIQ